MLRTLSDTLILTPWERAIVCQGSLIGDPLFEEVLKIWHGLRRQDRKFVCNQRKERLPCHKKGPSLEINAVSTHTSRHVLLQTILAQWSGMTFFISIS